MMVAFRKKFRGYHVADVDRFCNEVNAELKELRERVKQAEAAENALANLEKAKRAVEVELAAVQRERRDLLAREKLLVSQIAEYEKKEAEWAEERKQFEELAARLAAYEEQAAEREAEKGQIEELTGKIEEYEKLAAGWAEERIQLQALAAKADEYEKKAAQWTEELTRLPDLVAKVVEYEKQMAEWEEQRVAEYEKQAAEMAEARAEIHGLRTQVAEYEKQAAEWTAERARLENLLAELESARGELQRLESLRDESSPPELLDQLKKELDRALEQVSIGERKLAEAEAALRELNEEKARLAKDSFEALQNKDRYMTLALNVQKQVMEVQQECTRLEALVAELQTERRSLQSARDSALAEKEQLQEEIERLNAELKDYRLKEVAIGQAYILARHHLNEAEAAANEVFRKKLTELIRLVDDHRYKLFEDLTGIPYKGPANREGASPRRVITFLSGSSPQAGQAADGQDDEDEKEREGIEEPNGGDKWDGLLTKLRENLGR
ncbi:hypothetical protein [Desulforudis sp. DRI-14]|uniref:hypothetical protein n=1 Tax=Desulforudis sp. DRI-14 TaxID=3459793 RepID=UPI004042D108